MPHVTLSSELLTMRIGSDQWELRSRGGTCSLHEAASGTAEASTGSHVRGATATHRGQRLHDVTVVDVTGVGQHGRGREARQRLPLGAQQHDVAGRHLGEVGQAPSHPCNSGEGRKEKRREVKSSPGRLSGGSLRALCLYVSFWLDS